VRPPRPPRPTRINYLARAYAALQEKIRCKWRMGERNGGGKMPLKRKVSKPRIKTLIAYDLETTRIAEGTPRPLYITWHGADCQGSLPVRDLAQLCEIVTTRLLIPEFAGARFAAWNGNNFDVYLIAAALLQSHDYTLRPYLTRSKNLRGLRVVSNTLKTKSGKGFLSWEFLDAMAMTGAQSWPDKRLKFFLERFAPEYGKLAGPDWSREEFDANNPAHVKYAERDSEGLFHAMSIAQGIVLETFGVPLYPTIGNTGIRIFQREMPEGVNVWEPPFTALNIIRDYLLRGGYCDNAGRFDGPIWQYDINQAYAAAMRDCWLPAGRCIHTDRVNRYANAAIYKVRGRARPGSSGARISFYYRNMEREAIYGKGEITDTWITNEELQQLQREGWDLTVSEGWFWDEVFNMKVYVDRLEKLRGEAPGGPNGAIGLMVKAIGNNSYGKTVERLGGLELVLARDCPEGYMSYQAEDDIFMNVWAKFAKPVPRAYHQPQIGSFITAHVRMVTRRAALMDPDAWLYTDTDGCKFSRPVALNLDPKRYGFWKQEIAGEHYRLINKKTYYSMEKVVDEDTGITRPKVAHAKGLNVRRLTDTDFDRWYAGAPPEQKQVQKQNFVKVMTGFDMFSDRVKMGEILPTALLSPDERSTVARTVIGKRAKFNAGRDSVLTAIVKLGGLDATQRLDLTGERHAQWSVSFVGSLFRNDGLALDDMATLLSQYGYLSPVELEDVDGGVQALRDKIRDELDGVRTHYSFALDEQHYEKEQENRRFSQSGKGI